MKEKGVVDRDWFTGISIREINKKYKDFLKIKVNDGVIVTDVEKKSPNNCFKILIAWFMFCFSNIICYFSQIL